MGLAVQFRVYPFQNVHYRDVVFVRPYPDSGPTGIESSRTHNVLLGPLPHCVHQPVVTRTRIVRQLAVGGPMSGGSRVEGFWDPSSSVTPLP